jgi:ABC-type multidrug transport system ATPase subunit
MTAPTNRESSGRVPADGGPAAAVLARSVLFAGWTPEAIAGVTARFRPRAVLAGDVLCRQGELGDEMYVVEGGRFAVDATIGGHAVRFAELGPGAVFGEVAVLTRRPRSATVTALVPGYVWALNRKDFADLATSHPDLAVAAGRLATERLADAKQVTDQLVESGSPTSPGQSPAPRREPGSASPPVVGRQAHPGPELLGETHVGVPLDPDGLQFANEPRAVLELRPLQDALTIGRDPRNDLVLDDPRVSRRHALLRRVGDSFRIEDLGSTNGSFLNGRRVDRADLREGDHLQLGGQTLRFAPAALTHYTRGRGAQVDAVDLVKVVGRGLTILAHVALSVYPGELVAIVGGSGAGKTTLLNALAGVSPPSRGRVLYDGDDFYQHFPAYRQLLGYVPQDDIVHPELSVYRTLYFAARLRLPTDTSRPELEARIARVLDRLELAARRDTPVRSLSGGQRKRVSIGVELLTEPEVFYLDEPTSGLDPGLDLRMMELLRSLADQGRTVILTTHATRNVMLCDKVAFMARGGHLAFYGPPAEALAYFGVDDFVQIYRRLEPDGAAEQAAARFAASEPFERYVAQRLDASAASHGDAQEPGRGRARRAREPGWLRQLFWLTVRYLSVLREDRIALAVLLAAAPITAVMLSGTLPKEIFSLTTAEGGNARQALSLLFMLITSSILLGGFVASRSIAEEGPIYARERLVNLKIAPYLLSKALVLSLFSVIQSACLVFIIAGRIDIPGGSEALRDIFVVVLATNVIAVAAGLMASAVASNGLQATLIIIVFMMVQLAIAGGIVPLRGMDDIAQTMSLFTPGRWALSLLGMIVDINARIDAQLPKNTFAEQFTVERSTCWLAMAGLFVASLLIAVMGLKRRDPR